MMKSNIFEKRTQFKPFEYPQLLQYIDMIHQTFWVHSEVDFTADIQDYLVNLDEREKEIFRKSLLVIAQIEVGVKRFWGDLYKHLPKPEINGLGATFASNEWIHSQAYSNLLTVLNLESEFNKIHTIPVLKNKMNFIDNKLSSNDIVSKLFFFVIGVENASLFSQFANILSFTRFKGMMKNTSNIISWTSQDEQIHANAGVELLNIIFDENPELREEYNQEYVDKLVKAFIDVEEEVLDWVYESSEIGFFTKNDILNYMRRRIDDSLVKMNYDKVFNITYEQFKPLLWFEEEVFGNTLDDFFAKRPTEYTKHDKPITSKDLF